MLSPLRLSLLMAITLIAGVGGTYYAIGQGASQARALSQARASLAQAVATAGRAYTADATAPLLVLPNPLPQGLVYCPASEQQAEAGLLFAVAHPGANGALQTSCVQALESLPQGDDLVRLAYLQDIGNRVRAPGSTDWLPDAFPLTRPGQLAVSSGFLSVLDDHGQQSPLQGGGTVNTPSWSCPSDMARVVGADATATTVLAGAYGSYVPTFCVEAHRTNLNLTQQDAERDCRSRGRTLISAPQFARLAQVSSGHPSIGALYGDISYSQAEAGLSAHPTWNPAWAPLTGRPRGSDLPEYGPGGALATSPSPLRRRVLIGSTPVWDLVGRPQWTSTVVPFEDIDVSANSPVGAAGKTGWPDHRDLATWSSDYTAQGLPTEFPLGLKNIGYLLRPTNVCQFTLPAAFRPLLTPRCATGGWVQTNFHHYDNLTYEQMDAGVGGYYVAPATGVPLAVAMGGPWPGTNMGSGFMATAVVPVTEQASHRCVVAPSETVGR